MHEFDVTELVTRLVFQLAVILFVAKIAGEICERFLKIPAVLGELAAGIGIGPYALGGMHIGNLEPLFPLIANSGLNPIQLIPIQLWSIAQVASIVLLFVAGLETDLRKFLRYAGPATVVAAGGVIVPFLLGATATIALGYGTGFKDPTVLFMGAIMTATSVGITARVLSDLQRLGSPEGVTVLGAAVVDDVLGILILTVVIGMSATGEISPLNLGIVAAKAIGFWLLLMTLGILFSRHISRIFEGFQVNGANVALALGLAFLASGLAEVAGLAMIIGAYSIGLALSGTPLAHRIQEPIMGLYSALVPIFFVVMGMLVDISAMRNALLFGTVITVLAIASKVLGCGLPALGLGFNIRGATRIGLGMLPRGEVALIIAGVGLAKNVIGIDVFGVSILMTVVTTMMAPILLVPAFRSGGSGTRDTKTLDSASQEQ